MWNNNVHRLSGLYLSFKYFRIRYSYCFSSAKVKQNLIFLPKGSLPSTKFDPGSVVRLNSWRTHSYCEICCRTGERRGDVHRRSDAAQTVAIWSRGCACWRTTAVFNSAGSFYQRASFWPLVLQRSSYAAFDTARRWSAITSGNNLVQAHMSQLLPPRPFQTRSSWTTSLRP